jgi:Na+-transporting methylmalonyl-CoA/oxaloacetate decarboxylase gamma subunit
LVPEKTEESSEYMAFFKSGYENIPENATLMERLAYGGKVALIGMATVFLVLIIIWAICALMGKIFGSVASKEKNDSKQEPKQEPKQETPVLSNTNVSAPVVCSVDNTTITVVASAAIAAYRGEDTVNFTISSIRPCVAGAVALAPEVVAQIAASIAFLEGKDSVDFTISSIRIV